MGWESISMGLNAQGEVLNNSYWTSAPEDGAMLWPQFAEGNISGTMTLYASELQYGDSTNGLVYDDNGHTLYVYYNGQQVAYFGLNAYDEWISYLIFFGINEENQVGSIWIAERRMTDQWGYTIAGGRTLAGSTTQIYNTNLAYNIIKRIMPVPPTPPVPQGDATCKVNYYLQENDYTYSKITFKEDTPPVDMNDGYVEDIDASQSSINIENLVEGQKYYFTIFTDKSESEPFPYIVGPVITDWVNAELPSPMIVGELTKPYRYENQELISDISDDAAKALGYDAGETTKWLFDDLIPSERTSRAFWIFGNNQRGIYAYYHNISNQGVSAIKIYYKNTILVDQDLEWIASTPVRRNGILYFGKNDITCKGSIIYLSFSTNWFDTGNTVIKPFLINDTNAYYFITGRPNPADYTWYINNINGTGFKWKDWQRVSGSGYLKFPFSDYTQWRSDNGDMGSGDFNLESNGDARVFQTEKTRIDINTPDYVTYSAILNPTHPFEGEYYDGISTYQYYTVGRGYYYRGNYIIQGMTNTINGYPYTATGTLEEVLDAIRVRCKNVSIYVNGVCWSEV